MRYSRRVIPRLSALPAVFALAFLLSPASVHAAAPRQIAYELYSWPGEPSWRFSVFEGTQTARTLGTILAKKTMLRVSTYLKGRLATMERKDIVYWRVRPEQGLRLPPEEIVQDIRRFMDGAQIILVLPGEAPDAHPSLPPD